MKDKTKRELLALLLTVSVLMLCVPSILRCVHTVEQYYVSKSYLEKSTVPENPKLRAEYQRAQKYNRKLHFDPGQSDPIYNRLLNVDETGLMCVLEIPKIHLTIPVYHGTGKSALASGAGHLKGTSLPVGGRGTNAVIMAHAGVPGNRLFTDLHLLTKGDCFTVSVLARKLTYRVEKIRTIESDDLSDLDGASDKDLCTLITCRPEDGNSTRLLVQGVRVRNATAPSRDAAEPYIVVGVVVFVCLLALVILLEKRHRKQQSGKNEAASGGMGLLLTLCFIIAFVILCFVSISAAMVMVREAILLAAADAVYVLLLFKLADLR
ncbi:MAG: class C sortase [Anaerovoracaceae bacterium]|jgi:sortase A